MQTKLEKDVRFLKIYAAFATLVCVLFLVSAFAQNQRQKFEEIDVERINIVEKDGKLRMVISNRERQHPGIVDGKLIPRPNGRPPGMLFFNDRGDESGGLVFEQNNGVPGHFVSLTFDKFRQDQTVGIQHLETDTGTYFAGMRVWDRPDISSGDFMTKSEEIQKMPDGPQKTAAMNDLRQQGFSPERVTGRLRDKSARIELSDAKGKPRIRISVGDTGNPKMEFLNEAGAVTYSLPRE